MSSINYHHMGAAKVWYGVAPSDAETFETVMQEESAKRHAGKPTWHPAKNKLITMLDPRLLLARGVKVCTNQVCL
jgi:histone demethylase JARID1